MNERIHPILIGIILLLGAIGVSLSYMLYKATPEDQQAASSVIENASLQASVQASVATATPAARDVTPDAAPAPATTPIKNTKSQAVPETPRVVEPVVSQPLVTPTEEPQGRACTANDLTGKASWSTNGTYLTGTLRVKNASQTECVLSKNFSLSIYSGTELITSNQTSSPRQSALLRAGAEKDIWFSWSNWCGSNITRSAFVRLDLPENRGYIRVPVIDSYGYAQSGNPSCQNQNGGSDIDTWWY